MSRAIFVSVVSFVSLVCAAGAQMPVDSWPTYHGDYTGRRFSTLKQINTTNVKGLTLAWVYRMNTSRAGAIVGGDGPDNPPPGAPPSIKSTPLMIDGILYFSVTDHVWAVDARTGREMWHFAWKTRGGDHIGNRGVGILDNWLYFLTPDNFFISLDRRTGKERWHHEIASMKREYFSTNAPMIIGRQVMIGVGGDALDIPGYLESRDPESGNLVWRWYTAPRKRGEPGSETWPDEYAMTHGGGMPWIPGTYDPELNLYYFGTGNPQPVLAGKSREGDNLYTASLVAINPSTGKMAWYYQVTPHDTHDWDAAQVPVLIDGIINGRPRKLVAQASRNGHYFLLDRTNGEHIVTSKLVDTTWTKEINAKGQPIRNPAKDANVPGTLVSPDTSGATNWPPPSFSPDTGLLYVGTREAFSVFYLTDTDDRPQGWAAAERGVSVVGTWLKAIDYKTGQVKWSHPLARGPGGSLGGAMGLLSTAGGLLFGNDGGGNFVAYDAASGKPLWHVGLNTNTSNGPQTYLIDGRQYVVVGAGDTLYAFALHP